VFVVGVMGRAWLARALAFTSLVAAGVAAGHIVASPLPLVGDDRRPGDARRPNHRAEPASDGRERAAPERGRSPSRARGRTLVRWHHSVAVGTPEAGALRRGVLFPATGRDFFTWDPILRRQPNRRWRRWGTDDLVRVTLGVLRGFARAHPEAPRLGVGDLSRRRGGDFGPQFGGIGHATHQNGLDVDVYYPRLDRRERPPESPLQIDRALSQTLVDRFVAAGAALIYVGPNTGLGGPPAVVSPLANHDNHLHVRVSG